ncbi:enolase C-terminal domain-like protein [Pigmentiphaga soli]|uniref:Enolase C-terminal domain-like protein n=1 Tax=Pigmentiphaga soli TaxID=1007095 RepID=A0ABP8HMS4_9BURK
MPPQDDTPFAAGRGSAIERIATRIVAVPLEEPIVHPFLGARTQFATLLVEVWTADGVKGLGWATFESPRQLAALAQVVDSMAPQLKGRDALLRTALHDLMWNLTVDLLHGGATNLALAAVDIALWDIAGRYAGMPLWKLLGGCRREVPAYASWTLWRHQDDAKWAAEAERLAADGWTAMKLRLGGPRSFEQDVARAALVRRVVGPDVRLMVDALWGLTPFRGVQTARALGELGYYWLEEPVREGDWQGLADARAVHAVPIAAGERISRLQALHQLPGRVDHAILDGMHLGGVTPWAKAAAVMDVADLPVSAHSNPELHAHLLGAVRTGAYVEYMPWWRPLYQDPPQPVNGVITLGDRPGLGLELDEQAVRRFAVAA